MMSYHIPLDIQEKIIKRLPVKSVVGYRSVSKPWKSLIDSSRFINEYHSRQTHHGYVLITFVSVFGLKWRKVVLPKNPSILGSSQGLVYRLEYKTNNNDSHNAILWDPLNRKCVAINLPAAVYDTFYKKTIIGFGVCRQTNDPKIVNITYTGYTSTIDSLSWHVKVFSLNSGTWKQQSITRNLLDIDEFSYWLAFDGHTLEREFEWYDLIMSIDMTSEEFSQVDSLTTLGVDFDLLISKFRKPLDVLARKQLNGSNLRMEKKCVPESFKKLFKISRREASINKVLCGFMTSDTEKINEHYALFFYKPYSKDIKYIRIDGKRYSFFTRHRMDQLLLHDR